MSHYFTDNRDLDSSLSEFDYDFGDQKFKFRTDKGVFSKKGVDYGSYLLLNEIADLDLGNDVLDLGCGYGVIGIILKKLHPAQRICLVDVNSRAVDLAKVNSEINKVDINVYKTDDINTLNLTFDSIVLNPPIRAGKRVIYELYEKAHFNLKKEGRLFIVIQTKHGAKSHYTKLTTIFQTVNLLAKINSHWLIEAVK